MNISEVIKVLRFPLAVMVVYIHYAPAERVDLMALTAVDRPITTTLYTLFSFLVGSVAVPIFVAISGYLYFIKIGNHFSLAQYIGQSRKRVYTLAIPYIGWIAITWIASIFYNMIKYDSTVMQLLSETWQNLYYILWSRPLYFPFYFIRDLIVLSLLAPLWHWLIKHTSWVWLLASLLLYFSPIELFTGLSTRLLFYFSLGAARGFQERILSHFPAPLDDLLNVVTYITFPIAVVVILMVVYKIWAKVAPRSLSLLLGGRI